MEMLINGSEDKKLFSKSVPVHLTDAYTNHMRKTELFLTIEWKDTSSGMYNGKVLEISFTDNNDPFFLYFVHMTGDDFETLRSEQELRVPFPKLPQYIINYLETCLEEGRNEHPKFFLSFTVNEKPGNVAKLEIKEDHPFKQLIHLSLKFVAAAESAIKQYIASSYRNLKDKINHLENELAHSERDKKEKLSSSQEAFYRKDQELARLRDESNAELAKKDRKHAQELQDKREQLHNRLKEEQRKFEREKEEKDEYYRKENQQLQTRINVLETLKKEMEDRNCRHESTIEGLRQKVHSLEDEIKRLKDNVKSYRQKCDSMQSDIRERQSHISHQNEIINDLNQEIRSKVQSVAKLNHQIETESKKNQSLEVELDKVKLQLHMSERESKVLEKDKDELNDVILNLQDKIKKLKSNCDLADNFKKKIEEKENILQDAQKKAEILNNQIENKNCEIKSLSDSLYSLQGKITDLEKDLHNKEYMIKFLYRQLTDNGITTQFTAQSDLVTSPSNVAQRQLAQISLGGQKDSSPSLTTSNRPTTKSVRITTNSPVSRKSSSTPNRLPSSDATDSAYGKSPFDNANRSTPDIGNRKNVNLHQEADFDLDSEALNAAFGQSNPVFKHSTAKKPTKPSKSTIPKFSKKR